MGYTKGQQRVLQEVEAQIARGHRAGICNSEGESVNRSDGSFVAKPRGGYVTFRKVYPRHKS